MKRLGWLLAAPLLAQQAVNVYSPASERAVGESLAAEIRKQSRPLESPAAAAYVRRIGEELAAGLPDAPDQFTFEAISGGDWTEPFAIPGGYVFVPARALLAASDEDEFALLLAHAIGHVRLRHGHRTATRAQILNMAGIPLVYMGGESGSHVESGRPLALVPATFREFQRTYELEADRFGMDLAARAGFDPAAWQRYIARVQANDNAMSPLPARERRLEEIRVTLASLSGPPAPRNGEFRRVQESVRTIIEAAEPRRVPTLRR